MIAKWPGRRQSSVTGAPEGRSAAVGDYDIRVEARRRGWTEILCCWGLLSPLGDHAVLMKAVHPLDVVVRRRGQVIHRDGPYYCEAEAHRVQAATYLALWWWTIIHRHLVPRTTATIT